MVGATEPRIVGGRGAETQKMGSVPILLLWGAMGYYWFGGGDWHGFGDR